MTGGNSTLSRRAFVGKLAAGAAVAATAGVAAQAVSAREQLAPESGADQAATPYSAEPWAAPSAAQVTPPWELLQPLMVGAAVTALSGLTEHKGVLIAGGRDKMGSFDALVAVVKEKARGVVLLGEAAERLSEALGGCVPVDMARTMQGAVLRAFKMAQPGDAILLSPACSSLDMFKNYADRGDRFTEAVGHLAGLTSKVEK